MQSDKGKRETFFFFVIDKMLNFKTSNGSEENTIS